MTWHQVGGMGEKEGFHRIYPVPYEHVLMQLLAVLKASELEVLYVDPAGGRVLCNDGSLLGGYDGYWDVQVFRSLRGTEVKIVADNYFPLNVRVFRDKIHTTVNTLDRELSARYPEAWHGAVPPPPTEDVASLRVELRPERRALPASLMLLNGLVLLGLMYALGMRWEAGTALWSDYAFLIGVLPFFLSSALIGTGLFRLGVVACAHMLAIGLAVKLVLGFMGFIAVLIFPGIPGASAALAEARWARFRRELAAGAAPAGASAA